VAGAGGWSWWLELVAGAGGWSWWLELVAGGWSWWLELKNIFNNIVKKDL